MNAPHTPVRAAPARAFKLVAALIVLIAAAVALAWVATLFAGRTDDSTSALAADPAMVQRGAYLAKAGDCIACHTSMNGKPFAGGAPLSSPIGTIFSSNITPDRETGIGAYTYADFEAAVRRGVRRNGASLYPAMPYPSYAHITDADMSALYAFFMLGVPPVHEVNKSDDIPWPLSMRWPLTYWRWIFAPRVGPSVTTSPGDAELARGAYLVQGLGHCGACHTPRGVTLQELALTDADGLSYLAGGIVNGGTAPSLRTDKLTGLAQWTDASLVEFLKTGRNANTAAFADMSDVITHSTQFMTDSDLAAVAHYLKSLAPAHGESAYAYDAATANALYTGHDDSSGARLYLDNCAACHRSTGLGYPQVFPALAGNQVVNGSDSSLVVRIILHGSKMPYTETAPSQFTMPDFAWRLSDQDVADVASFIRGSWGNRGAAVTASMVAKIRAQTQPPSPSDP